MDTFLFQFVLPVLALFTMFLIFVAFKAIRFASLQKVQELKQVEQFEYTKQALGSVGTDVKGIRLQIDESVLPEIKALYQQLAFKPEPLTTEKLIALLDAIGWDQHQVLGEGIVLTGLGANSIKISYILNLDPQSQRLHVYSFAFTVQNPSPDFLLLLLQHNHNTDIGTIGVRQIADKFIIAVDHVIELQNAKLTAEKLQDVLRRLGGMHIQITEFKNSLKVSADELLFDGYFKMLQAGAGKSMATNSEKQ